MRKSSREAVESARSISRRGLMLGAVQAAVVGTLGWRLKSMQLDRADEFLSRDLAGGLRRAVTEQRDRLARALRNRAVDRG